MDDIKLDEEAIYHEAREVEPGEARESYLRRACGDDADLRARVEALLRVCEQEASFLEVSPCDPTVDSPATLEPPGTEIGPYKLLEVIGEGGMGVVYLAEQSRPMRRKVALKVIKPGMDSNQVVARFEAERQALAIMDHPSIAKVLDGGTTPSGRPYFVMELVKGVPITEYCDRNRLTPRQRLELFVPVCQAVQHAHQKGIIHRDLKPSNVLVAMHDTTPGVKIIDFGVAKALGQELTDRTLFTGFAQMIGTPLYMSPEQAGESALDIDTRSDIYSLGVLLYELLTGTTPLDKERFARAAYDEIRRIIREEDPPRPSNRLTDAKDSLPSISAQRGTEPMRLTRLVRGDLDWIVMKCLDKDRGRRYETASGLARDLERHLHDEPVDAGPPSAWYRARKFSRKHRAAVLGTGAFVVLLVVATTVSAGLAWWANKERARATAAEKNAETRLGQVKKSNEILTSVFRDLHPDAAEMDGKDLRIALGERLNVAAEQLEGKSVGDPFAVADLQHTLGVIQGHLGYNDRAISLLQKALATIESTRGPDHTAALTVRCNLASAYRDAGRTAEAISLIKESLGRMELKLGVDHRITLDSRMILADGYMAAGRLAESIPLFKATLKVMESKLGSDDRSTLVCRGSLAVAYLHADRPAEAIVLLEPTLKVMDAKLGPDRPITLTNRSNLAAAYTNVGRIDEAIELNREMLRRQESRLGPHHPDALRTRNNLAGAYHLAGRFNEAIALYESTLKAVKAKLGPDHPQTLVLSSSLATAYRRAGRFDEAIALYQSTFRLREAKLGAEHPDTLNSRTGLAIALLRGGRTAEAIRNLEELIPADLKVFGPEHAKTLDDTNELASGYAAAGLHEKSERIFRECLAIRERKWPENWATYKIHSQLGDALIGQGKYAEAEPLLIRGYEGMRAREAQIPKPLKAQLREAALRIVKLYECWGRPEEAVRWRDKLGGEPSKDRDAGFPADPFRSEAARPEGTKP